jgi:hypothetical protein
MLAAQGAQRRPIVQIAVVRGIALNDTGNHASESQIENTTRIGERTSNGKARLLGEHKDPTRIAKSTLRYNSLKGLSVIMQD